MMKGNIINIERILVYYDTPQVFIGKDCVGTRFLCLFIDSNSEIDTYVAVRASELQFGKLLTGQLDLRDAFVIPEIDNEYITIISNNGSFRVDDIKSSINEELLPEKDFYLATETDNALIESEVVRFNNPIIHIGFVDNKNSHSIEASALSNSLSSYQSLLTNCCAKLGYKSQTILRVFVDEAASYNLHMYVDAKKTLFGDSEIDVVLSRLDEIFNYANEDELVDNLRRLKGYTLSHYKKFIKGLIDKNLSIKYKWKTPAMDKPVVFNSISLQKLENTYALLQKNTELNAENIVLQGVFSAVSIDNTTWRFKVRDESSKTKSFSGKCSNPDLLYGVVIINIPYEIICEVRIKTDEVTKKETKTLFLEELRNL